MYISLKENTFYSILFYSILLSNRVDNILTFKKVNSIPYYNTIHIIQLPILSFLQMRNGPEI
jgi:hypothetical protein